jgi:hypothetical protein
MDDFKQTVKDYEVTFRLIMPSNVKETEYRIHVKAVDQVNATQEAILAWDKATEPRNINIREVVNKE